MPFEKELIVERDKRYGQRHVIQIPKSCVQCCFILSFVVLLLSGFVVYHIMAGDEEVDLDQSISMFDIGKEKKLENDHQRSK